MPNNPDFVRQADYMVTGMTVDMDTGWSISGYDVVEFPEDRDQARFVKRNLNLGRLEAATQAEYDEAHPEVEVDEDELQAERFVRAVNAAQGRGGTQEHVLREREGKGAARLRRARAVARAEEEGYDVDEGDDIEYVTDRQRRQNIIDQQQEDGLDTDDPEEQKERTATRASGARKAAGAKKKSSRGKKAKEEEPTE